MGDHEVNASDLEVKGKLAAECASIVFRAMYTVRMNRPDINLIVNCKNPPLMGINIGGRYGHQWVPV